MNEKMNFGWKWKMNKKKIVFKKKTKKNHENQMLEFDLRWVMCQILYCYFLEWKLVLIKTFLSNHLSPNWTNYFYSPKSPTVDISHDMCIGNLEEREQKRNVNYDKQLSTNSISAPPPLARGRADIQTF